MLRAEHVYGAPGLSRVATALGAVAACVLASACGGGPGEPAAQMASRAAAGRPAPGDAPTVLLVTVDTLRADRLGCYGRANAGTPAMDTLAATGTRFAAAQTTAPLTLPAHASILTGRGVPAHGVLNNGTYALPPAVPLVSERFRAAGWATGAFVSSPVLASRYGLARGFDVYDDDVPRPPRRSGIVLHYDERAGAATATRAADWLEGLGAKPAFLWVHLWEPHAPYRPPAEFAHFADNYQGEVATADAALASLLGRLRAMGRARVLVALLGDHGEGLGEHGEPTHGVFLYRATMHVPFIVSGDAFGVRKGTIEEPVSAADVAPTLLDLAGVPPLGGIDGLSLAPALTGRGPLPARAGVFAESHLPQLEFGWSGLRAYVSRAGKLVEAPRPEYYDAADAAESRDLARTAAARVRGARSELDDLVRRAAACAPREGAARSASSADLDTLRSLGYASSGRHAGRDARVVDPGARDAKDRVAFLARYDRATLVAEAGDAAGALVVFEELVKQEPRNPALLLQYGQALIVTGALDRATAVFETAVAADPGFGLAWYRLGQLYDNTNARERAVVAYRKAIDADPLALDPRKALGSLLAEAGDAAGAVAVLEEARRLDPHDVAVARELQRLHERRRS